MVTDDVCRARQAEHVGIRRLTMILGLSGFLVANCVAQSHNVAQRRLLPSMQEFNKLWADIGKIKPSNRDYPATLDRIEVFCRKYPGSKAAVLSLVAVEDWLKRGWVSQAQALPLLELRKEFNPGRADLDEAKAMFDNAKRNFDVPGIEKAAQRLQEIAKRHPGTLTEYTALANLPGLYARAGDWKNAYEACRKYFDKYPHKKTALAGSEAMEHYNTFLYARLTGKVEGVGAAIDQYRHIAAEYAGNKAYEVPALFEGGELALKHDRLDDSLTMFSQLVQRYQGDEDEKVIVSHFRIGETLLKQRQIEAALALFENLSQKYSGTRFRREAQGWVKFAKSIQRQTAFQQGFRRLGGLEDDLVNEIVKGGPDRAASAMQRTPVLREQRKEVVRDSKQLVMLSLAIILLGLLSIWSVRQRHRSDN